MLLVEWKTNSSLTLQLKTPRCQSFKGPFISNFS